MKIVHTADIHLNSTEGARWHALERVLELADGEGAALLAISGDLFDRRVDALTLKTPLRELFQRSGIRTVIVPGNHDTGALAKGDFYGNNVSILADAGQYIDVGGARVFGLPFERIEGERILQRLYRLKECLKPAASNILLFHGELVDMMFSKESFGEDEETGYMPAKLSYFDDLGIDYVLAGHFHTNFDVRRYEGGYFVYPGSPVSISKKETGIRSVNLFELGSPPAPIHLDTLYYEDVSVHLDPFEEGDPMTKVRRTIEMQDARARLLIRVSGFVDLGILGMDERMFASEIDSLRTARTESIAHEWNDINVVTENDLFARCMGKLDEKSLADEDKARIRKTIIQAMMEAARAD